MQVIVIASPTNTAVAIAAAASVDFNLLPTFVRTTTQVPKFCAVVKVQSWLVNNFQQLSTSTRSVKYCGVGINHI